MGVLLAEVSGFCYGVRAAVESLEAVAQPGVYTFGQIIHNAEVVDGFAQRGVGIVEDESEIDALPEGSTLVIRAHGAARSVYERAEARGLRVVDATCPFVSRIHRLAEKATAEGRKVVIIGNERHPEIIGIAGWCRDCVVYPSVEEARKVEEPCTVLVQTTYEIDRWNRAEKELKELFPMGDIHCTICPATEQRQRAAAETAERSQLMIVVGDKKSANTNKLRDICSAITKTYMVQSESELDLEELGADALKIENIGVIAGASTPDATVQKIIEKLKRGTQMANENLMAKYLDDMPETISIPRPGSIVEGKIIVVSPDRLVVNIGCKNDGVVPKSEISLEEDRSLEEIYEVGQDIDVYVVNKDDGDGNVFLSIKRVSLDKDWGVLKEIMEKGEEIDVKVTDVARKGVTAYYNDIRGFIPASQLSVRFTKNLKPYVGKTLKVQVLDADRGKKRAIFTHKPIAMREHEAKEEEFWGRIEEGLTVKGGVKRITDFGIFVDIGGKDGLVHNSEISWGGRPRLQSDMPKVGDIIDVKILDANREKDRVSLSIKRVTPEPWSDFEHRYYVDYIYRGKVVNLTDFGAFVELEPGVEGLVHISQITRNHIKHPSDVLEIGQVVEVKILEYSVPDRRVKLSIKAVEEEDAALAAEEAAAEEAEEVQEEPAEAPAEEQSEE